MTRIIEVARMIHKVATLICCSLFLHPYFWLSFACICSYLNFKQQSACITHKIETRKAIPSRQ